MEWCEKHGSRVDFTPCWGCYGELEDEIHRLTALLRECEEAIVGLNQVIRNSQDVMSIYLQPDGDADMAIDHLLYLLDGPEQRVIQTKVQVLHSELAEFKEKS